MQATTSDCLDEAVTIHKEVMDEENLVFEDNTFHLVTSSLRLDWCRITSVQHLIQVYVLMFTFCIMLKWDAPKKPASRTDVGTPSFCEEFTLATDCGQCLSKGQPIFAIHRLTSVLILDKLNCNVTQ